jgi:beta-galactosidase
LLVAAILGTVCSARADIQLSGGVKAVWDLEKAYREKTPTRERVCLNGLWRWQPAKEVTNVVPSEKWGYFKVPGCWPGITDYMQKDSQTVHTHPSWKNENLGNITAAWYQREITIPGEWANRRIAVNMEYLNSYAGVFVDGKKAGEIRFPGGEVDLTPMGRAGSKHVLSMLVVAMPLKGVMLSYNDTASAREVRGSVARRGLCGDVFLIGAPPGARIADVKVDTSIRKGEITLDTALESLEVNGEYTLCARIMDNGRSVREFTSKAFKAGDLRNGRIAFAEKWKPEKLWDLHTPHNVSHLQLSLMDAGGKSLDISYPVRFGFRELWIDGRDFFLNGTRIFLSAVPLDNAQVGTALANYEAAKESLRRLKSFGINFVYTHNYGCEPGSHLSFAEILRAADDLGMLVSFSQPHFGHYEWKARDADRNNGYARHAEFYVRAAQNHPSVVMYSMSHNATDYDEDMNPDMIDGVKDSHDRWSLNNSRLALRAEAIVKWLDPSRIIYHHSSGNLGSMHTTNFYPNFAPIQELSDWFEYWAIKGVKPVFTCEYGAPFIWDWTMYRGWYQGKREFGRAKVPWEFCLAEWNSQFLGDRAFQISEMEKANLRWEAKQFRAGNVWHHWDYPHMWGSRDFDDKYPVYAMYITDNWRAFRTWGVSANSPWEHGNFWKLRDSVDGGRKRFNVDWENLQRPGFSPDYVEGRYERMDLAFERSDWIPTVAAQALIRNNLPLLAYIGGKSSRFTSKDHNFFPGETVEKQLIVINNSRVTVTCDCEWSFALPRAVTGTKKLSVKTGQQERIPLRFDLPAGLAAGSYQLSITVRFSTGETQKDSFIVLVLPQVPSPKTIGKIALFDPKGETGRLLNAMGIQCQSVDANVDLSGYDVLVVGKAALTVGGRAPDITSVRDGLKVVMFEQASDVLEKRFGFRVQEYGLRQVFKRVPDHPLLAGIAAEHLSDWRGAATILPPRLKYELSSRYNGAPSVRWCDIEVTRVWRCGNYGNVASVLIEKPVIGDFLPIVDGGFSLQYSPLMEYREGKGMVLFCQMDVSGRTGSDPAAETLARNILEYVSAWKPTPRRKALYIGDGAGKNYLKEAGVSLGSYEGGNLSADQVLIVGPSGGYKLSGHAAAVGAWLKGGGNLLLIGLDEKEANTFLPLKVRMKNEEHISTYFEPPAKDSLLEGVGPADVHNRDPRELALIREGASAIGNGILAKAETAKVVFCQLVPWQFEFKKQYNLKRTYRRASFLIARLLANMGVSSSTPLLARFHSPVKAVRAEKRWLEGLYLDSPEEWDDPYRFFRW